MCDPRNSNPFQETEKRDPRNEHDAHLALLETIREIAALQNIAGDLLTLTKPKLRIVK